MRKTFIYTLFGLAMTAVATAGEIHPAGEVLPQMIPTKSKRHAAAGAADHHAHRVSRGTSGDLIPVSPAVKGLPVVSNGKSGSGGKRRFLHKDEVVVPDSLQNPASKRALSCPDANYGVCPSQQMCCPIGGLCCKTGDCCDKGYRCCTTGECCPETHNCVTVNGINGCCPIGQTCSSTATQCADSGYVPCQGENFCCPPGDTCMRDSSGKASCKSGSANSATTTTTATTTPAATTTTTPAPATTTTSTTPAATTTTTTTDIKVQDTTTTSDQQIPTTASQSASQVGLVGGPPTTMYNPTAITTLPNASKSVSNPSASVDIPVGNTSGAMAITVGLGYSVLVTAVSFALGHVLVMA